MEANVTFKDGNGNFLLSDFDNGRAWVSVHVNRAHVSVILTKAECWELIKALGQFASEFMPAPQQEEASNDQAV